MPITSNNYLLNYQCNVSFKILLQAFQVGPSQTNPNSRQFVGFAYIIFPVVSPFHLGNHHATGDVLAGTRLREEGDEGIVAAAIGLIYA